MTTTERTLEDVDKDLAVARKLYLSVERKIRKLSKERERLLLDEGGLPNLMELAPWSTEAHKRLGAWFQERGVSRWGELSWNGWALDNKKAYHYPALRVALNKSSDVQAIAQKILAVYAEYPPVHRPAAGEPWLVDVFEDGLSRHAHYSIMLTDEANAKLIEWRYGHETTLFDGYLWGALQYIADHHPYTGNTTAIDWEIENDD